ncbi:MAG: lantibiotic dehydratase family protein [Deltaproteobacteria bacterium]|nr:lantibiotic dehydratase family protein [Deltaproteobacteria bacterium]
MSQTKSSRTQDYQPSTHFVLRSPLLPYDELLALREGLSAPHARPDELDESVASDRTLVRRRLRGLAQRPEVKEAIFFASPDLGSALDRWLATEAPSPKLELTLAKYFARMCGRPSPFGLFAGISIGVVSEESSLELPPRQAYRPSTHLELSLLSTVVEHLESDPALERRLRFRPAVTVERRGSRVRYVDRAKSQKSAERSEYLDAALDRAGPLATLEELATAVQLAADADPEEATAFVRGLVERGLLRSELEPAITGPEPLDLLADRLDGLSPSSAEGAAERARGGAVVSRFRAELRRLDQQSVGRPTHAFRQLFESLGELSGSVELPHAFHVDLVKPATKLTLSHEVVDELARAVGVLRRFHRTPSSDELEVFRKRFVDRYEGRSVPLTEVFDESSGPSYPPIEPNAPIPWAPTDSWLLERTLAARAQHQDEIEIVEGELATLDALRGPDQKPLPGSFGVMASLAAASEDALRRGDFRLHLGGQHGPSGATTLGRFCHSDPRLAPLVEEIIRSEEAERPGVLFAELVTSPDPSLSNLVVRPVFRAHEIPILARGSGPIASRIPLSDLVVSVRNGRFVLYSRSRGLEVVPRLTSALNFRHKSCSPLFRFLGSLQIEGLATVFGFEWGLLATTRALPRVRYRKTVLALARWRLDGSWTERLANAKTDSARVRLVRQLRDELGVPRMVHLVELDTFLILDLDDVLSIHILCQSCTGRPSALLTEAFSSSGPVLRGPEGRFVHDLVITFTQTRREEVPKPRVDFTSRLPLGVREAVCQPGGGGRPSCHSPRRVDPRPRGESTHRPLVLRPLRRP